MAAKNPKDNWSSWPLANCSQEWYEPRERKFNATTPGISSNLIRYGATANISIEAPLDPCSMEPSKVPWTFQGPVETSVTGYTRSTIIDQVLTNEAKTQLRLAKLRYPKRCFKPVSHVSSSGYYGKTPNHELVAELCVPRSYAPYGLKWSDKYEIYHAFLPSGLGQFYAPNDRIISENPELAIRHVVSTVELAKAFVSVKPSFSREVDSYQLPVFLAELRELKRLSNLFAFKYAGIAAAAADKFLGINFGLKPLLKDISTMQSLAAKLDGFVALWNRMADEGATMAFHQTIWKFEGTYDSNERVGTTDIKYSSEHKNSAYLHLYVRPRPIAPGVRNQAYSHLSGLDSAAGTVWELVPWSFVVDWFTNFGSLFDVDEDKGWLTYDIVDCGYSVSYNLTTTSTGIRNVSGYTGGKDTFINLIPWTQQEKSYERFILDASMFDGLTLMGEGQLELEASGLNPFQTLLAGALVASSR